MSPLTIAWTAPGATCLTLGFVHLVDWLQQRTAKAAHVPLFVLLASLAWFVVAHFGTTRLWLAWTPGDEKGHQGPSGRHSMTQTDTGRRLAAETRRSPRGWT